MNDQPRTLIRPALDLEHRRVDTRSELLCLEFELDRLDVEIAAEQLLRWRELAPQLAAHGFDVSDQPEPKLPRPIEQRTERRMAIYTRELELHGGYIRPGFWPSFWR